MGPLQSKRQLQSLLGLFNYYRRYISNFSTIVSPLFELLKDKNKFVWNDIHNNSFTSFKNCLASIPSLQIADFNKQFYIYVDASSVGIGGCLMQENECGDHLPVCFYSKKLTECQRSYSNSEREALALVMCFRAFKTYLSDNVIVFTDHQPLKFILSMADKNHKILRYKLELDPYNIIIKHVPGKLNKIADYLSRCQVSNSDFLCARNGEGDNVVV